MQKESTLVRGALWTLGAVLVLVACGLLWTTRSVLFLIFISLLLAAGIDPLVNWLRKGPFNRSFAILIVYSLIFAALALILYLSIPPLVEQVQSLIQDFGDLTSANEAIDKIDNPLLKQLANTVYQSAGDVAKSIAPLNQAVSFSLTIFSGLFGAITVFVITFYWLTERKSVVEFFLSFLPQKRRARVQEVWQAVEAKLGAWVRGELVLMLFIGTLSGIGYTIMGLKFAFALAVLAGLTELIPLVGPYIGGAPAVLVALTQSVTLAIIVVVYIVLLQVLEGNLLVPRVMEKAVGVSPLAVIVGILIGSTLIGIPGALLAVPIAAILEVLYNNNIKRSNAGAEQSGNAPDGVEIKPAKQPQEISS